MEKSIAGWVCTVNGKKHCRMGVHGADLERDVKEFLDDCDEDHNGKVPGCNPHTCLST